jgi:hypothetical protein
VLTKPCLKGEKISVKICEDEYLASVLDCQNVLLGKFTLPKVPPNLFDRFEGNNLKVIENKYSLVHGVKLNILN